ncbi:hypothetical protein TNCV_2142071 [Trichonephila clavipes]|uniref:Uncharacterized protein n=1 Tax=Trichonephila clavipes TaxID=2585209 RepID=A0A8X6VC77_TRICX|nr:hypothetical protein TNCV_2142071 [Trichonephila clavipes]
MPTTKAPVGFEYLQAENYKFEVVNNFAYLGSNIDFLNYIGAEIKKRIIASNRCLYVLRAFLQSELIKRRTQKLHHDILQTMGRRRLLEARLQNASEKAPYQDDSE